MMHGAYNFRMLRNVVYHVRILLSIIPKLRSRFILPYSNNSNKQHTFSGVPYLASLLKQFSFPKFAVRYNTALFSNIYVGDGVVSTQSGPLIL